MMMEQSTTPVDSTASVRRAASRRAFTLVEVLIAAIILAIGLVGLAAVFPAVITQQQAANDLTTAVSVSGTADGILATRLPFFRSRFSDPNVINRLGTAWNRINAVEDRQSRNEFYLQTPYLSPFPDLRLRESATFEVGSIGIGGTHREYTVQLPRSPIATDNKPGDLLVRVSYTGDSGPGEFTLIPDLTSLTPKFIEGQNASGRMAPPVGNNSIDFRTGRVQFYFNLNAGQNERLTRLVVEFRWLNDRIVSHPDRLYPTNAPRYGWELAFRRNADGQLQYTTFIYRFDGMNAAFVPEIPGRSGIPNSNSAGMLRLDSATVLYNQLEDRFELRTSGSGMADQIEAGSWLLPVDGTGVVRVRRSLEHSASFSPWFELEGPPMWVDPADGIAKPMIGTVNFWYMPTTIKAFSKQGQEIGIWRIRPLLATTKQVQL